MKKDPRGCDARVSKANFTRQPAQHSAVAFQSQRDNPPRKSGGRASRQKGNRAERALVRFFQDHGFAAERVPLSGAAGGSYLGDLTLPLLGRDILVVRADRKEPLVIVPLTLAGTIARTAEHVKGDSK